MTHTDQLLGPDARTRVAWRISSYSTNAGGNCVEAGALPDATGWVAVRHSHHPDGPALVVSQPTWATFVHSAKNDDFITRS
ncbi:MAG: DUF397 domain-containing protein [Pseudonocardiaceae bacterium]